MRYIYLTNNNGNNKGDILYLDENHFLVQYWQKRGIIKPYEQRLFSEVEQPQKDEKIIEAEEKRVVKKKKGKKR